MQLLGLILFFIFELTISSEKESQKNNEFINDYHFPMVTDEIRNQIYYSALEKVIGTKRNMSVLDVGAGTMLLSMMSLKLGASKVLGVESDPSMCKIAREVLRVNNFSRQVISGKISLYEGTFESLHVGHKQLKKPVDIMVSETFDAALIGEKFLSVITHAKSSGVLKKNAIIIPNSAVIFGQLLESTLSLRRGANNTNLLVGGMFNLEPMRKYRPSNVYTVRYLNEQNAVRKKLSSIQPLFTYDFQNYDILTDNFAYTCVLFEITEADEGVFDSIGLWFNLYLDKERKLVLSNSPDAEGYSWMQAMYRVSKDVMVKRGDIIRIQIVQTIKTYIFGDVGNGYSNENSRLVTFVNKNCTNAVKVYLYNEDEEDDEGEVGMDGKVFPEANKDPLNDENLTFLGTVPANLAVGKDTFEVFSSHVHQRFMLTTVTLNSKKRIAMHYQLPDSTAALSGSRKSRSHKKIPLDSFEIFCPK